VYLLVFPAYIEERHGSRSRIPSKNLVRQRCAEGFNSGVKGLKCSDHLEIRFRCLILYFKDRAFWNEIV
jgi:hypothetical protein